MITHRGKIINISNGYVTVSIAPTADECSGCAISGLCSKGETIDVPLPQTSSLSLGQEVTIGAPIGLQRKATILYLVIPIILILGIVSVCVCSGMSQTLACVVSLSIVVLWYVILYMMRVKIQSKAQFKIIE